MANEQIVIEPDLKNAKRQRAKVSISKR